MIAYTNFHCTNQTLYLILLSKKKNQGHTRLSSTNVPIALEIRLKICTKKSMNRKSQNTILTKQN